MPTRYTFAQFDERTSRRWRGCLDLGLEPGAKVAMYSWNRAEWAEIFFGRSRRGRAIISVNYRYVAHELEYVLENSDSEVIVLERSFAPIVR